MTGSAWPRGLGVQTNGCVDDPCFERLGTEEAAGDAREDQGDVPGAEGGRSAAKRGGELFAEVDELADEAEEAAGAAGLWVDGGLSGGHEQTRNTKGRRASKNFFLAILLTKRIRRNKDWMLTKNSPQSQAHCQSKTLVTARRRPNRMDTTARHQDSD